MTTAGSNIWPLMGGLIVLAVVLYFGFRAVDAAGIPRQSGSATVTGKEYRPAAKTYRTDLVGGQTRAIPQVSPERYVLKLEFEGKDTECTVSRDLYQSLQQGDRVQVVYQKRRLTGALQVTCVSAEGK